MPGIARARRRVVEVDGVQRLGASRLQVGERVVARGVGDLVVDRAGVDRAARGETVRRVQLVRHEPAHQDDSALPVLEAAIGDRELRACTGVERLEVRGVPRDAGRDRERILRLQKRIQIAAAQRGREREQRRGGHGHAARAAPEACFSIHEDSSIRRDRIGRYMPTSTRSTNVLGSGMVNRSTV